MLVMNEGEGVVERVYLSDYGRNNFYVQVAIGQTTVTFASSCLPGDFNTWSSLVGKRVRIERVVTIMEDC